MYVRQAAPAQVHGVEGKYASALYSAGVKSDSIDRVEKDLGKVRSCLKEDKILKQFCDDPSIKRTIKVKAWTDVLEKLKLGSETENMLGRSFLCGYSLVLMAENGRLNKILSVTDAFDTIMTAHRGEVTCVVTTATELDSKLLKKLKSALQSLVDENEKVDLILKLDPSIVGGMTVSIGDKYVDMSIARKIRLYEQILRQPV